MTSKKYVCEKKALGPGLGSKTVNTRFSEEVQRKIAKIYTEEHLSISDLGRRFSCSPGQIKLMLKKQGVEIVTGRKGVTDNGLVGG